MALLYARRYGQWGRVQALLEAGTDVDSADVNGLTALMIACIQGHAECARLLLEAGADLPTPIRRATLR